MDCTYHLHLNSGSTAAFTSNIQVTKHAKFRYDNKAFQVVEIDESYSVYYCREVEDPAFYDNYFIDTKKLLFEDRIIEFFRKRQLTVKPNTLTEDYFKRLMLDLLAPNFIITREVAGIHFSGRKMKIDAMLRPKENSDWRNKNITFGIEFKNPIGTESNNRRDTDCLAQCFDYTFSEFPGYDDTIILICPLLSGIQHDLKLLSFTAGYNLGYVDFWEDKINFKLGLQMIWQEETKTPYLLRKSPMKRKYGNRGYKIS